ncbi:MAG: IS21 family transposase [Oscillospiraceae bacterium]|nr:IS21 family transposase [Oscillospiraceae bacterium]
MFKKTKVRQIIELLQKKLSDREISNILEVSRNSVARIRVTSEDNNLEWDELLMMTDDELYRLFYPDKFKPKTSYAPVDYSYVHSELGKVGVTEALLWEEYCDKCKKEGVKACSYPTFTRGYKNYTINKNYTSHIEHKPGVTLEVDWSGPTIGYIDPDKRTPCTAYLFVATFPYSQYTYVEATRSMNQTDWLYCNVHMLEFFEGTPVKIVCDNLKTGVISHPKHGEIVLNDAYLSFAEHYQVAIVPAAVRKPKQKASVEGSVGKIARKIIGILRNQTFYSLESLNVSIKKALNDINSKEFQKRNGSRKIIFETEEKPALKPLPMMPFEICEWSYNHKVGLNSHIWFNKGQYSVPNNYLGQYVDVKYSNAMVYIYSSHKLIAEHKRLPSGIKNGKRTEASHLPYPIYTPQTIESSIKKAEEIGSNTATVVSRIYENAKIKEQALVSVRSILDIADIYDKDMLETACGRALKDFYLVTYNSLISYVKEISRQKNGKSKDTSATEKSHGIVRGASYYGKDGAK